MEDVPLSLREQCFLHLVIHVMEFSPQELAFLPEHYRQKLLRTVAPVYLYYLEQTAVADGIDTDAIWNEINQHPEDRNTRFAWTPIRILDSHKDGLAAQYLASVWDALLGAERQIRVDYYSTLVKIIFSTHVSTLEDSTADFLKSHKQPWFVPIVTNHQYTHQYLVAADWETKSESKAAAYLIEIGALPTVLDLSLSRFIALVTEEQWCAGTLATESSSTKDKNGLLLAWSPYRHGLFRTASSFTAYSPST